MAQSVFLKLTSAIGLGGVIARAGTIVEVTEAEAINLLDRGKAILAEAEDAVSDFVHAEVNAFTGKTDPAAEGEKPADDTTKAADKPAAKSKDKPA